MEWLNVLLGPAVSVLIILIGGAVMIGKFEERCKNNEEKIIKVEKDISERVSRLEEKNGMTIKECDRKSEVYRTLMCDKIEKLEKVIEKSSKGAEFARQELSRLILKNRDEVLNKFDTINLFIGETKSIMEFVKDKIFREVDRKSVV